MVIEPFDASELSEEALAEYAALRRAANAADLSGDPSPGYADAVGEPRRAVVADCGSSYWMAVGGGRILGSLELDRARESVRVEVLVHPEFRRRGIGSELLRFGAARIEADGGEVVCAVLPDPDPRATAWIARAGFQEKRRTLMQVLPVRSTPQRLWRVKPPPGYRLEHWTGPAPESLLESYAAARRALSDAPNCPDPDPGTGPRSPARDWNAKSIREAEYELAAEGTEEWVSVAVENRTGQVAGVSVILRYAGRPASGYVNETSVLAVHRGRGLSRAIKGARMRWIRCEHPEMVWIMASTDSANSSMNAVNRVLGYRVARTVVWAETTAARLAQTLAKLPAAPR
jgi:mycothiol synthase